jgi:lipoate-protein ligase A
MSAPTVNEDLLGLYFDRGEAVFRVYEPESPRIVLGAGGVPERDVHVEAAAADGVPLLRRLGGGGTVLLSPGQLVLALVTEVASPFHNVEYARRINSWIAEALTGLGVAEVADRGISDLAIGERKILGTSLYRRRRLLFYQASLLVDVDLRLFSRYLRYPHKVPDYRREREHQDFCTTLRQEGFVLPVASITAGLSALLPERLKGLG